MSNLVPVFYEHLNKMEEKHLACGVILAACKTLTKESMELIKQDLGTSSGDGSEIALHYAYDKNKQLFGILLEGQKLSNTHFYALRVKDYLQEHKLLAGSLLIASFPESSRSSGQMLMRMIQEMREPGAHGEIKIYEQNPAQKEGPASILLVNHDETVNEFLSIYFQRKGYLVTVANDGMDGMEKYQEVAPDLVITDLNLPILNGYQLMEKIKDISASMSKIMVLTDKRLEEDVQKSFAMGASDYITKPFSPVELEARVKRLIS
ncbi:MULTISPECIES: response regulator transcription factor [Brevibacillus]|uniref:response regulator transcription factor n=1 Tax=Brevibacillus TaxID=55080 RepID=UPI001C8D7742|nr:MULTISPECIES: response regulator transcription factor [Brevibacillus]MBY0085508.1 response regulator transcription factor [Brevibacillus brevis]MCE0453426.1 response regulator transcription factor [Brevibacillus sp. AF8]MCM3145697.1 response regulator transcription factor [Brevibacillus sp. MER 51]